MSNEQSARMKSYREWMEFVDMDLLSARYLLEAPLHPRPLAVVCYHAQQAAEKAVKALIVYYGSQGGMSKVHDISFLLGQIKNIARTEQGEPISQSIWEAAEGLTIA